jgi:glycosyltransferase involved in cell wall biosynthesis
MRILHVIANLALRYGGPSKACLEMAQAVANLGHTVSIYTTNQDGPTELNAPLTQPIFKNGVEIRFFPIQWPRFWGTSLPLARALREIIQQVDVVHLHSLYLFHSEITAHYCQLYKVPYLVRPHGTLDPFIYNRHRFRKSIMEWLFENKKLKQAAAIHFTTEEEKQLAKPYIFQTPGIVIPLGINLSEYENLPVLGTFKARYPETIGKRIILFLGRINFKKGLDILVQAFAKVVRIHKDVHLVVAGPDNDGFEAKVRGWLTTEKLLERVTFTGMLQGNDKLAVLRDAEMFVLPSYSENFGIAVIEAMACSLPVLISNKVNLWQAVEQAQAGLVASCEVEPVATKMMELLDKPDKAKQMGKNGKVLIKEKFQWHQIGLNLEKVYRKILSNSNEMNEVSL